MGVVVVSVDGAAVVHFCFSVKQTTEGGVVLKVENCRVWVVTKNG